MDWNMLAQAGQHLLPAVKDTIPELISTFITTVFLNKKINNRDLLIKLKEKKFFEVAEDLLNQGQITYLEFYKCNNFLKIAKLADEVKSKTKNSNDKEVQFDFDWFVRFFEASGNISNEQMQMLWARVLAGEVNHPGAFSLRTIETLNHMTFREAVAFSEIANLAMHTSDGMWFVITDGASAFNLDEVIDLIIPNNKIRILQECGLLNPIKDDMIVWYSTNKINNPFDINEHFFIANERIVLLFHANDIIKKPQMKIKKNQSIFFPYYPLSESGIQLLKIVDNDSEYNPILELGSAIKKHRKSTSRDVTAHEIKSINNGIISFDEYDLL